MVYILMLAPKWTNCTCRATTKINGVGCWLDCSDSTNVHVIIHYIQVQALSNSELVGNLSKYKKLTAVKVIKCVLISKVLLVYLDRALV